MRDLQRFYVFRAGLAGTKPMSHFAGTFRGFGPRNSSVAQARRHEQSDLDDVLYARCQVAHGVVRCSHRWRERRSRINSRAALSHPPADGGVRRRVAVAHAVLRLATSTSLAKGGPTPALVLARLFAADDAGVAACVRGCRIKANHRKLVVIRYQIPRHDPWPGAELWRCGYVCVSLIARVRAGRFGWLCASNNGECLCDTLVRKQQARGCCLALHRDGSARIRAVSAPVLPFLGCSSEAEADPHARDGRCSSL
jgi:hypothetical protein